MTGPIEIDVETVRSVAQTLVATYENLSATPPVQVERGDQTETTEEFRRKMERALDAHAQNRETLIIKLAGLSQQLRRLGGTFAALEDEYCQSLYQLESEAYAIQERRTAETQARMEDFAASGLPGSGIAAQAIAVAKAAKAQQGGSGSGSGDVDGSGL